MRTIASVWREIEERFRDAALDDVALESQLVIGHVMGLSGVQFLSELRSSVSDGQYRRIFKYAAQRVSGRPLGYVLGEWEFAGRVYRVGPGVLIPRPETEVVLETAMSLLCEKKWDTAPLLILEFGMGSGILSIELATRLPLATVIGWEKSVRAARYARQNIAVHGVPVQLQEGDFFKADFVSVLAGHSRVLVVGNPPYIPTAVIPGLMREVAAFEPKMALDGGVDGLAIYRRLARCVRAFRADVLMVLEIGFDQGPLGRTLLQETGFGDSRVIPDLAGRDRVLVGGLKALRG